MKHFYLFRQNIKKKYFKQSRLKIICLGIKNSIGMKNLAFTSNVFLKTF